MHFFFRCEIGKGKLTLTKLTFIASPILEILSQTEIKLNWLRMTLFLVYMHGTGLNLENLLLENNITPWYFLIVSAKNVEVPIELSEDCHCNLRLGSNKRTLLENSFDSHCHSFMKTNLRIIRHIKILLKVLLATTTWPTTQYHYITEVH